MRVIRHGAKKSHVSKRSKPSSSNEREKSSKQVCVDAIKHENGAEPASDTRETKPADIETPQASAPPEAPQAPPRPIDVAIGGKAVDGPQRPPAPQPPKVLPPVDIDKHSDVLAAVLERGTDESTKLLARYHRRHVIPRLHRYGRTVVKARPSFVPSSDNEALKKIENARASHGARKEDREFLRDFGKWRGKVFAAETKDESNLVLLLSAYKRFEDTGDDESAFAVKRFLTNEYRIRVPDASQLDPWNCRRLSFKWSRRYDVLSELLRVEDTPSDDHPSRMEPEDDAMHFSAFDGYGF